MVEKIRMQYDNRIIYKENALRSMLAVIKQQSTIGLLVDQAVFPEEGFMIPFLGRIAWASKAPVVLSRKTGVAVLPSFIHRESDHHVITFYPECVFEGGSAEEEIARDVKSLLGVHRTLHHRPSDRLVLGAPALETSRGCRLTRRGNIPFRP